MHICFDINIIVLIVFGDIHGARRSCSCLGLTWPRWHSSRKSLKLDYTGCMIFSECLARQVPAAPPKSCCVRHLVPASRYWYDRRPRETEEVQEAQKEACQHSTVHRLFWFELQSGAKSGCQVRAVDQEDRPRKGARDSALKLAPFNNHF